MNVKEDHRPDPGRRSEQASTLGGMVKVHLPSILRDLAGDSGEILVPEGDVRSVVAELESRYPRLTGRMTDELGSVRPHVKIFVNGETVGIEAPVKDGDEVRILPAISGGSSELEDEELLVGTRKGLIVLRGPRGDSMQVAGRAFEGNVVEYAIRDQRTGTYLASVTDAYFGPRVYVSSDPLTGWEQTDGPVFPDDAGAAVERIWTIEPGVEDGVIYAGVAPAALFRSDDNGRTWALNRGLWDRPERAHWQPGAGGMCLHSICPWPGDPSRLAVGISAAGVWLSDDGGESWRTGVTGLLPRYLPEGADEANVALCVHDIKRSPVQPDTIYMQFHGGVYRSDDAGGSWNDIGTDRGLPSDFGFPLVIDSANSERAFVIPLKADVDRTTPEGRVRVFETTDRGSSWDAHGTGLPEGDAYLTILRQAFCGDGRGGEDLGLYFGATSGDVFGSVDGGQSWSTIARHLPPVTSVRCGT
jgi:molybdopterin converting factor small subunit